MYPTFWPIPTTGTGAPVCTKRLVVTVPYLAFRLCEKDHRLECWYWVEIQWDHLLTDKLR